MRCNETQHIVYVNHGDGVMLSCTCFDDYSSQWLGPNKISGPNTGYFMPSILGKKLNQKLNQSKYRLFSEYDTHKCCLQITNFLSDDDGAYKCLYVNSSIIYINVFIVSATRHPAPPEHLSAVLNYTTFVVYWQPGLDGGHPQSFYIEYRPETKSEWEVTAAAKSEKYNYHVWQIISSLLGGILILSICLNIHFLLRRKKNSGTVLEIPPEGQYYEIGPINDSSVRIQGEINNVQEAVIRVDRSASQSTNSITSSFQNKGSSESSVQSLSNKLPNEDGYENPYQTIDPENIEMHPYSIVTTQMYQNTLIFPKEITTKNAKKAIQNNKDRSPWLIIYNTTCVNA
ncbi:unnamed protein product [Mytilus coruscus]|uniref:Uncharacterized protein n=1 Tax=Mytilus coruscus TaxID=42192 RepID=A0A6J8BH39_MYTCO|nr:unnamed protein product [Mytilus coruscus]